MQHYQKHKEINSAVNLELNITNELDINYFLEKFYYSKTSTTINTANYDSYSFLLLLFTSWVKFFHNEISIELINRNHFKIKINKIIGHDQLENFYKLFEELTLNRFYIVDDDIFDQWICDLFF